MATAAVFGGMPCRARPLAGPVGVKGRREVEVLSWRRASRNTPGRSSTCRAAAPPDRRSRPESLPTESMRYAANSAGFLGDQDLHHSRKSSPLAEPAGNRLTRLVVIFRQVGSVLSPIDPSETKKTICREHRRCSLCKQQPFGCRKSRSQKSLRMTRNHGPEVICCISRLVRGFSAHRLHGWAA